jgi:hypothetical protein
MTDRPADLDRHPKVLGMGVCKRYFDLIRARAKTTEIRVKAAAASGSRRTRRLWNLRAARPCGLSGTGHLSPCRYSAVMVFAGLNAPSVLSVSQEVGKTAAFRW